MAVRSKTTIFDAALLRTGNGSSTEASGTPVWQALEANYDEIVREAFEGQEFPFGKARETLTSRTDGRFGYDDAYKMPDTVVHVEEVFLNDCAAADLGESWEIDSETNELMVDARGRRVEVRFIKIGLEHTWSSTFARAIQRRLEAVAKDVLEETEEASMLDSEAAFQVLKAGVKASDNRSKRRVRRGGRLTQAHRGR